jgi:hypothetical protein
LEPNFQKSFQYLQRSIKVTDKVSKAITMVDDTSTIMKSNISQLIKNSEAIQQKLLPESQNIKIIAQKTKNDAE